MSDEKGRHKDFGNNCNVAKCEKLAKTFLPLLVRHFFGVKKMAMTFFVCQKFSAIAMWSSEKNYHFRVLM